LLLARQTLLTPYRSTTEDALVYDGDLVRFAEFREMVYGKTEEDKGIRLAYTLLVPVEPDVIEEELDPYEYATVLLPKFFNGSYFSGYKYPARILFDVVIGYDRENKIVGVTEANLFAAIPPDESDQMIWFSISKDESYKNTWELCLEVSGKIRVEYALGKPFNRFIPVWDSKLLHPSIQKEPQEWYTLDVFFKHIFTPALTALRRELTENLYYIGPLRSAPQRPYIRRNVSGLDIGSTGEYTIQQLHDHWEDDIRFVALPDNAAEFEPHQLQPTTMKLGTAVRRALLLLGMEQEIKIERPGQSYEASLSLMSEPETYVAITDVGFGVSQILPVIALGLLSPADALLLFEQPEIHLHPRAQAGLADFLLCLARSGRRVVVETHSDHMIDRFRRRMAEDNSNTLENSVQVLFVHPPAAGQGASIETAQIDRYGMITNWPAGFLTESAKDARATMLAASNKRMREKKEQKE
jgi:predicted ATPase